MKRWARKLLGIVLCMAMVIGLVSGTITTALADFKATPAIGDLSTTATYGNTLASVKSWLDNQKPIGLDGTELAGTWAWVELSDTPVGNVGSCVHSATFTPTDENYGMITKEVTVTVGKAPLTVKAKDKTITYGDTPANGGVECTGFVNNERRKFSAARRIIHTPTRNMTTRVIIPLGPRN